MSALLFLDASGLDSSGHDDLYVLADLHRIETMCREGAAVEAYWFAQAHAHSLARHIARVRVVPSTERQRARDLARLRAYLRAARTISGGLVVPKIRPGDYLRPVEPAPTHAGATLFRFTRRVTNPSWSEIDEVDGIDVEVVRYQNKGFLLDLFVSYPDRQRWQWSVRTRYRSVDEAVREGNRLATIGLAVLGATGGAPPAPASSPVAQLSLAGV